MGHYDYLNARVRGMSTMLLSRTFFEQLVDSEDESLLIDALLNSSYESELRSALTEKSGVEAVSSAIRRHIAAMFRQLLEIAPSDVRRLLKIQLNRWDVANVLAVIRGTANGAGPDEKVEATLPVGELTAAQLSELAAESSIDAVMSSLITWNYTFAFALRRAVFEHAGASPQELELRRISIVLNQHYFTWALDQLGGSDTHTRTLRTQLQAQIDLYNVKSALDVVRHRQKGHELGSTSFVDGGSFSAQALRQLESSDSLETAFEELDPTSFGMAVERGILAFGETRNPAVMERFFENVVIEKGCRLFRKDPLTIAVPLGYIWRHYNEFVNLRILLRGKRYRMPPNAIREELLLV